MSAPRLDKWLWAARFFRTRSRAKAAIEGGLVKLNGNRTKPAKELKAGDTLTIRRGFEELTIEVMALSERRGNAQAAATLYAETALSVQQREARAEQRRAESARRAFGSTRPTGRERRRLTELKRRQRH